MKKIIFILLLSCATLTQAQKFKKLDVSPMDRIFYPMSNRVSDKAIIITYSRPQLKGRKLAELVPAYKVWRTGANEATEIRILKPVKLWTLLLKKELTLFTHILQRKLLKLLLILQNMYGEHTTMTSLKM